MRRTASERTNTKRTAHIFIAWNLSSRCVLVPEVPGVIWPDPCPLWHRRSSLDFPRFSFAPIGCEGSSRRSASEPITYHKSTSPQLHLGGGLCVGH